MTKIETSKNKNLPIEFKLTIDNPKNLNFLCDLFNIKFDLLKDEISLVDYPLNDTISIQIFRDLNIKTKKKDYSDLHIILNSEDDIKSLYHRLIVSEDMLYKIRNGEKIEKSDNRVIDKARKYQFKNFSNIYDIVKDKSYLKL